MELLIWLIITVATVIPLLKVLPHFGIERYWAFAAALPLAVVVLLWIMAMKLQEMERR